jgi:hypothetical protein
MLNFVFCLRSLKTAVRRLLLPRRKKLPPKASFYTGTILVLMLLTPVTIHAQDPGIYREIFAGITGTTVATLTSDPTFTNNTPTSTDILLDALSTEVNRGDNYGQRLRAFVIPPMTGFYTFWIASDDASQLFLSSNDQASSKRMIASANAATATNQWNKEFNQQSLPIFLVQNGRYYLEVLHKEGTGGDFVMVKWQRPDNTQEEPMLVKNLEEVVSLIAFSPITSIPVISSASTDISGEEGTQATLTLNVANNNPLRYQWQRNPKGNTAWNDIPEALNSVYMTPPLQMVNLNDTFRCIASSTLGVVTSDVYTVSSITPDATAPTVVSVSGWYDSEIRVTFSEPMDPASTTNKTFYTLTSGALPVSINSISMSADLKTARLITASMTPGSTYTLTVSANGPSDNSSVKVALAQNAQASFTYYTFMTGTILRQFYAGISGTAITTLLTDPNYPNSPSSFDLLNRADWPAVNVSDNYGARLSGMIVPPITGTYTFAVQSDDSAQLYVSSNEQTTNKVLLINATSCCQPYDTYSSVPMTFEAGKRYFFEAVMKEGTGGDYLRVAWKTPWNPYTWEVLPGSSIGMYSNISLAATSLTITQHPGSLTIESGQSVYLSTEATGTSSITGTLTYQWLLNGQEITGAISNWYATPPLNETNSGLKYSAVASLAGKRVSSSNAVITINPDLIPPRLQRAGNIGTNVIFVAFSESVEPASATNMANYKVTNGLANLVITRATLSSDPRTVLLTTDPFGMGVAMTVTVNNIRDTATNHNILPANSTAAFTTTDFAAWDVGSPGLGSQIVATNGGYDVRGIGVDVMGFQDQMQFSYQVKSGNFDVQIRVAGMSATDAFTKGGLMVRESLTAASRFGAVMASPTLNGISLLYRSTTMSNVLMSGYEPVNYPNTWLRLQRAGDVISGYASYDGNTWSKLGAATIEALPTSLYFGLAVSSHSSSNSSLVQFRDMNTVTNALSAPVLSKNFEPPGPTSRRSGIVVTEINYKPAPRTDGQNVEFLEIYNSTPIFEDLSGWRISGDVDYIFPAGTRIEAGQYLVVALWPPSIQAVYGLSTVFGPYTGSLKTSGTIRLRNELDAIQFEVTYDNQYPWPVGADDSGHSLVLARASYGEMDPHAWAISTALGGSPGQPDGLWLGPSANISINELLVHTDLPQVDYLELYNHSTQAMNISGWTLSDDATTNKYVIPNGTIMPPRGFLVFYETNMGFGLSTLGEKVFLRSATNGPLVDAINFPPQTNGMSYGRYPDGVDAWQTLTTLTPATNNSKPMIWPVAINEIMFEPISALADDQYVELYNPSATAVNLGGWRFIDGIDFSFPSNTVIAAGGYLVVAKNKTNLLAKYNQLNSGNTYGDFAGKLSGSGEKVTLAMPLSTITTNKQNLPVTNTIYVEMDSVTYKTGGKWGKRANGGGSSLELEDVRANHRLGFNWGDSDETAKSSNLWTTVEWTGYLDHGSTFASSPIDRLEIFLMGAGECLVDNVEVMGPGGSNWLGSVSGTFESGIGPWTGSGDHVNTYLESTAGYGGSSQSLHLVASERGDTLVNNTRVPIAPGLVAGDVVTLRARVRWIKGWPEVLLRLKGNYLEAYGRLQIPGNLGTPGQINSRKVNNTGPAIYDVTHHPILPAGNQTVLVTAKVQDPDGISYLQLKYRVDPSEVYNSALMNDNGTSGDLIASDGIWSATLPAQPAGSLVAFHMESKDGATPATFSFFPTGAPNREGHIRFGDPILPGSYGTYRMWMAAKEVSAFYNRPTLSNERIPMTFVYGNYRVFYGAGVRFSGSPYHQVYSAPGTINGWPETVLAQYAVDVPGDDLLLGTDSFNKIHMPGNSPGDDVTIQREQTVYHMARKLGLTYLNRRYVYFFYNGIRKGFVMEDTQVPGGEMIDQWYAKQTEGNLYKLQPWFEFKDPNIMTNAGVPAGSGTTGVFENKSWSTWNNYPTTNVSNGQVIRKTARFRYNYLVRAAAGTANNFNPVFELIDKASATNNPYYISNLTSIVDMEEYMRTFAFHHACGNWDTVGYQNSQNTYGYKPVDGKWHLMVWDCNIVLGNSGSHGPWQPNLMNYAGTGPNMVWAYNMPVFLRAYFRGLQDMANVAMAPGYYGPVMDARWAAFQANGLDSIVLDNKMISSPSDVKSWVTSMSAFINYFLLTNGVTGVGFNSTAPSTATNNLVTITGSAPLDVKDITINGIEYPVTWTSLSNWLVRVPLLNAGTNTLIVQGEDVKNQVMTNYVVTNTVNYLGTAPAPQGVMAINEINYNTNNPNAQFVEVFNSSTNYTFDLTGWQINGLSYNFPEGTAIGPKQTILLVRDAAAFTNLYGNSINIFDTFAGSLDAHGETLTLQRPVGTNMEVVAKVRYETYAPWPLLPLLQSSSLQLADPAQDSSRVANWVGGGWKFFQTTVTNSYATDRVDNLRIFLANAGQVMIDSVQVVTGLVANSGNNLLSNGGFDAPFSSSWKILGNYASLSSITNRGGYRLNGLRVYQYQPGGLTECIIQSNITTKANTPYTISYWYLPVMSNITFITLITHLNSYVAASNTIRSASFADAISPGSTNSISHPLPYLPPVWLNEVLPQNLAGATDNFGEREPWIEIYNSGTNTMDLSGWYLGSSFSNITEWALPAGTSIGAGQFLSIWADGQTNQTSGTNLHTSFRLPAIAGVVTLTMPNNNNPLLLDYLTYSNISVSYSYGNYPDGQPFHRQDFFLPTLARSNSAALGIFINEWMADNLHTLPNPASGNYEDWIELYNPSTNWVNLEGYYLTDTLSTPSMYKIPPGYKVPPRGYLIVWADNTPARNATNSPDLHVNFALSKGGEAIGLFADDGSQVDAVTFGAQTSDVSMGRYPDGGSFITNFTATISPRQANYLPFSPNTVPLVAAVSNRVAYVGQLLSFQVGASDADQPVQTINFNLVSGAPAGTSISSNGWFSWIPATNQAYTTNLVYVYVTDSGTPPLSATNSFKVEVYMPFAFQNSNLLITNNQVKFGFSTIPGKTYQIEYKNALLDAWSSMGGTTISTNGTLMLNDVIATNRNRFYRIIQLN